MIPRLLSCCDSPYYIPLRDLKQAEKEVYPPPFIIVYCRKVSFNDDVDVIEVEKLSETENGLAWYREHELSKFIRLYSKDSSFTRNARSFNHTRRVLLHQNAYNQMGAKHQQGLDVISRECSKNSKLQARKTALAVAMEVDGWLKPTFADPFDFSAKSEVVDLYLDQLLMCFQSIASLYLNRD
jgi:hypothetical protein